MKIGRQHTEQPSRRPEPVGTGVALCVIGRQENRYAREYVQHYLSLGFDHIIICDNNRDGEERFEDVLYEYIQAGQVEIIDFRNKTGVQCAAYSAVYRKYSRVFRWMAFFDFDEYLTIVKDADIHELMARYDGIDCVLFNWMNFGDNGLLRFDGRMLQERFTTPLPFDKCVQYPDHRDDDHCKCMLRGGLDNVCFFSTPHIPNSPHLKCCTSLGEVCSQQPFQPYTFDIAYLRHYITKTTEEYFSGKWQKGTGNKDSIDGFRSYYAGRFFKYNEWTREKDDLMRHLTGMPAFHAPLHKNVVIVHYNTQALTDAAIRSLNKHTPGCNITVFDNSDKEPFVNTFDNVTVLDNTTGVLADLDGIISWHKDKVPTPENKYGSAKHCISVDVCCSLIPEGFLLMDSDVLVKKDITPLFDDSCVWTGQLQVHTSRFGVTLPRVLPFICYINVPMMRKHGISYYNDDKMFALTSRKPDVGYDTGCWFYEACHTAELPENHVDIRDYIIHFGHGSWMNSDESEWLETNKQYWQ